MCKNFNILHENENLFFPYSEIIVEQMRTELLRVTGERDKLANQVKADASCLEEKVNEVKLQCKWHVQSLSFSASCAKGPHSVFQD